MEERGTDGRVWNRWRALNGWESAERMEELGMDGRAGVSDKRYRVLGRSKTDRGVWRTDGGAQEYLRSVAECCEVADGWESVGAARWPMDGRARKDVRSAGGCEKCGRIEKRGSK